MTPETDHDNDEAIGEAEVAAMNLDEPVSWLFECFRREKPVLWETAR